MQGRKAQEENSLKVEIKGADRAKGDSKCMREEIKREGRNKLSREKKKAQTLRRKNKNSRWKTKGAESAKEENKMHERDNLNLKGENEGFREIRNGTRR